MNAEANRDTMIRTVKTLSERVWESRVRQPDVEEWLANYRGDVFDQVEEQLHALHLLTHFNYFGVRETRVLLTALYRDLVRYPIIQEIRSTIGGSLDEQLINRMYLAELERTRFLAMGNPSESGSHLLYYFRQVNHLQRRLFIGQHELADGPISDATSHFNPPNLKRIVFIDDLLVSGQQASRYSRTLLRDVSELASRSGTAVRVCYYVLFATPEGARVASGGGFDEVKALFELDDGQKAFSASAYAYQDCPAFTSSASGRKVAHHYGGHLIADMPLGYRDGQLLLGFQHNVPDNTLPVFWWDEDVPPWRPIFARFNKVD